MDADGLPEFLTISRHYNYLLSIFPSANRNTLIMKCKEFGTDEEAFCSFVSETLDDPTLLQTEIEEEFVLPGDILNVDRMDVEDFLQSLRTKDPLTYFEQLPKSKQHKEQMFEYLKDRYLFYPVEYIASVMVDKSYNLLHIVQHIAANPPNKTTNDRVESGLKKNSPLCINFVKEVRFVENYKKIEEFLLYREELRLIKKIEGDVFLCECCYADDVLDNEIITCSEGHIFCDTCVQKYVEVRLGEGKLAFPCLDDCVGFIPLQSVKNVISNTAFEKLCSKIQEGEVKMANIPGIEFCSFCEYAAIPEENEQYFFCSRCRERICRLCKQKDHTPLNCKENEKEGGKDKLARLLKEESASNKILRKCLICNHVYVKDGGCNVVVCKCGTKLCYLCSTVLGENPYSHGCFTRARRPTD
ncbi:E3 ubiquitin-protein ligase RNF216-like [Cimex lectularius]|uniref:RING-type domain-containing protein n=1 Tax=Cimex lectularius TaxID=79782 RepID=A0A8I6SFH6_CIMLE|nr:E3 ubiquitin-protein ligase RNF216-like [Cimex lectularius]XP_024082236.1 E3 ubiquitin-protein ligase RNF216-like [Cimex lectularius]